MDSKFKIKKFNTENMYIVCSFTSDTIIQLYKKILTNFVDPKNSYITNKSLMPFVQFFYFGIPRNKCNLLMSAGNHITNCIENNDFDNCSIKLDDYLDHYQNNEFGIPIYTVMGFKDFIVNEISKTLGINIVAKNLFENDGLHIPLGYYKENFKLFKRVGELFSTEDHQNLSTIVTIDANNKNTIKFQAKNIMFSHYTGKKQLS